jgi:hypothetical protein
MAVHLGGDRNIIGYGPAENQPIDFPGFAVLIREANEGGLKPGVCSGLILSGVIYPDSKIGVWRRRKYQI